MDTTKRLLLCSAICATSMASFGQDALTHGFSPYLKAVGAIGDGNIEVGPQYTFGELAEGTQTTTKLALRMKLTDKDNNLLQVDRNTTDWSLVGETTRLWDKTAETGPCTQGGWSLQYELGQTSFTYYPKAVEADETTESKTSFAVELKWFHWRTQCGQGKWQWNPQFRIRYSVGFEAADEVGVVRPIDSAATYTLVENMIIDAPVGATALEPAIACNLYPGKGSFSFTPAAYYSAKWAEDEDFSKRVEQTRFEFWTFFYPNDKEQTNSRFGVAPFLAVPMKGNTDMESQFGALFTIQFKTSFLKFF